MKGENIKLGLLVKVIGRQVKIIKILDKILTK